MQKLIPFDDALAQIIAQAPKPTPQPRPTSIFKALKGILAEDIISAINVPPADNSAMDGYALRIADLDSEGTTTLPLSQRIPAGTVGQPLKPHTAARIFTGAFVPQGADAVIMQEKVSLSDNGEAIFEAGVKDGQNIRRAGEDIKASQTILGTGKQLNASDLGLAASVGIAEITLYQKIKVAVMCTGDELVEPGTKLADGQIYNSNRFSLIHLLEGMGCEILDLGIIKDTAAATDKALSEAAQKSDLIISSGGVSVGEEDHVKNALERLGELKLWKMAIKPGKPLAFGKIEKTPFIGLPGNPVSTFVTFCMLARPYIKKMQGQKNILPQSLMLPIDFERPKAGFRREFIRVQLVTENGISKLKSLAHQGSGVLSSVSQSDGLAIIVENRTYKAGDLVEFLPFSEITG